MAKVLASLRARYPDAMLVVKRSADDFLISPYMRSPFIVIKIPLTLKLLETVRFFV